MMEPSCCGTSMASPSLYSTLIDSREGQKSRRVCPPRSFPLRRARGGEGWGRLVCFGGGGGGVGGPVGGGVGVLVGVGWAGGFGGRVGLRCPGAPPFVFVNFAPPPGRQKGEGANRLDFWPSRE